MSVLVAVDPESRFVEVVTGAIVRDHLDDQSCRLACLTMTSRVAIGDIAAGIRDGIIVLGTIALKRGKTRGGRIAAWIAALLVFGYMVAVAVAHNPVPFMQ